MSAIAEPNAPALREQLRDLRRVDNVTNLLYLALDYACLIATIGGAVYFAEQREAWGLARAGASRSSRWRSCWWGRCSTGSRGWRTRVRISAC